MSDEKTTVKGLWWKDHDTNHQLQGQITYGPLKGAEVDLFGQFNDSNQPEIARERFTLHGTTHDNKAVSLFACLSPGGHFSIPGGATTIVRAVSGIVGGHFHSLDDVKFKKVTSRFTALREWVWTTGITMLPESEGQLVNAAYALPPIIPLGKFGPLTTSIEFHATVKPGFNTLSIDQDCSLLIEADSMQPYEVFYECISSFQQFLTLALQRSAYPTRITGQIDEPRETIADTPIFEDYMVISSRSTEDRDNETLTPHDLLFTSRELSSTPAVAFTRFVESQQKLAAAMDLYFTTVHNKFSVPRVRFLTLAHSLEGYHRATAPGLYLPDDAYQNGLRKRLWEAVPKDDPTISKDFRASLDKKLNHLHEYSLRKRLKELAGKHSGILESLIGTAEAFSTAVSETRNNLTHPTEQNRAVGEDYQTLWVLCEKMALLLEVCFLEDIGFTSDKIKQIVATRSRRARSVHRGWV